MSAKKKLFGKVVFITSIIFFGLQDKSTFIGADDDPSSLIERQLIDIRRQSIDPEEFRASFNFSFTAKDLSHSSESQLIGLSRQSKDKGEFQASFYFASKIQDESLRLRLLREIVSVQKELFSAEQLEYTPAFKELEKDPMLDRSHLAADLNDTYSIVYDAWDVVSRLRRLDHNDHRKISEGGIEHEYDRDTWTTEVLPLIGSTRKYVDLIREADAAVQAFVEEYLEKCHVGQAHYWGGPPKGLGRLHAAVIILLPDDLSMQNAGTLLALIQMMGEITEWQKLGNLLGGSEIECGNLVGCPDDDESESFYTSFHQGLGFSFYPYTEVIFPFEVVDQSYWTEDSAEKKSVTETCR